MGGGVGGAFFLVGDQDVRWGSCCSRSFALVRKISGMKKSVSWRFAGRKALLKKTLDVLPSKGREARETYRLEIRSTKQGDKESVVHLIHLYLRTKKC